MSRHRFDETSRELRLPCVVLSARTVHICRFGASRPCCPPSAVHVPACKPVANANADADADADADAACCQYASVLRSLTDASEAEDEDTNSKDDEDEIGDDDSDDDDDSGDDGGSDGGDMVLAESGLLGAMLFAVASLLSCPPPKRVG